MISASSYVRATTRREQRRDFRTSPARNGEVDFGLIPAPISLSSRVRKSARPFGTALLADFTGLGLLVRPIRHNAPSRNQVRNGDMIEDAQKIERVSSARVPTEHGEFQAHVFRAEDGTEHLALVLGKLGGREALVRVHSECLTGDALGSLRCDCGDQLQQALARIATEGSGVVIYLRGHEGRGIGIGHKIAAYALQDSGLDTVDANVELGLPVDDRRYDTAARILLALGVSKLRLMTNNPAKVAGLTEFGLDVERLSIGSMPNKENLGYLRAKQLRMGHMIDGLDTDAVSGNGDLESPNSANAESPRFDSNPAASMGGEGLNSDAGSEV